jgi:Resolvase, N terminal domain
VQASKPLRAALYTRVSTADQTTENQLLELRRYAEARAWQATEYVDQGVSGAKAADARVATGRGVCGPRVFRSFRIRMMVPNSPLRPRLPTAVWS